MSAPARRIVAKLLVVLASVVMVPALVAGYGWRAAVDSDQFANRATAALRDDSVRSIIAERITDDVVLEREADLIAARPLIQSVASAVVASRAFTRLFRSAVRDLHRAVFVRDQRTITLTVADVGTVLAVAVEQLRPSLARDIEAAGRVDVIQREAGGIASTAAGVAGDLRLIAIALSGLWLVLVAAAVALSPDRRRTVMWLGAGAAAAAAAVVVAYGIARAIAVREVDGAEARAAAGAIWDAFLGDLRTVAWVVGGFGAVVAAAAASLLRPVELGAPLRRAALAVAREPRRPALRVLRGLGLAALGVAVLVEPGAFVRAVATAVGLYLVYEGASAVLRLVYRPAPVAARDPRPQGPAEPSRRRRLVAPLLATALVGAVLAVFLTTGGTTTAAPAPGPCNGREALCDRPFDEVALPATHNSMSVPLPGWFSAEHERPIARQLRDGIRGLLVDTHYGDLLGNGRVRTFFGSRAELRRRAEEDGVSREAVDAALRTRERAGFRGPGERGMYLCHSFCELGATPLGEVLDDLHDFLVANPDEVVVVINQDYVTPADMVAAVRRAGLEQFAYKGPADADWPTLREMIDTNQRLVLLAENHAGAAPWYRLAYDGITEETPFAFSRPVQLTSESGRAASCRANRGREGSPLFLLNHWITTSPVARPSHAAEVNAYEPLLARARECARLRRHAMNVVAVNFYERGALFRVVDTLNGVR
jgi:hypothetical protein